MRLRNAGPVRLRHHAIGYVSLPCRAPDGWANSRREKCRRQHCLCYLLEKRLGSALMIPIGLYVSPVGIMTRRKRLAHTRRTVAESDVSITSACVAELGETPVFKGFDTIGAGLSLFVPVSFEGGSAGFVAVGSSVAVGSASFSP